MTLELRNQRHILRAITSIIATGMIASVSRASCAGSGVVWSCGAGSTVSEVQTAVNGATNGAVITFSPGNYSWASAIRPSNSKGVTFICSTQRSCYVNVGTTSALFYMDSLSGANNYLYRISGFTFQNIPSGAIPIWFYGNGTMAQLRIDHNNFDHSGVDANDILLGEVTSIGTFYGVIDHNNFTGYSNNMALKILGTGKPSTWPTSPKGTDRNLFFEDNVMTFTKSANLGSGCIDAWNSTAVVFRHNTTTNCLVTSHGVVHGGGTINFELYENKLIRTSGSGDWEDGTRLFHHQGSGEFVAFNNTFTAVGTKSAGAIGMTHYRSANPIDAGYSTSLGRCDGTNSLDGNRQPLSSNYGYPCWRQPGRDGAGNLQPMYIWNNRWSDTGALISMSVENPWGSIAPSVSDHIMENRDYYNAVSSFNGTKGMGSGLLANRPSTCVPNSNEQGGGVGYFATDVGPQGTLYRCSAANTWTIQYVPYVYPHPLVSGIAAPPSPSPTLTPAPTPISTPVNQAPSVSAGSDQIVYLNVK